VVDTSVPALTQGGVAVLLDDDLNTASLQFYRQSSDGGTAPVQLLEPATGPNGANPLEASLASSIIPTADPWRAVSGAAAELIAQRHRLHEATEKAAIPKDAT
jgi:hypothetical protein